MNPIRLFLALGVGISVGLSSAAPAQPGLHLKVDQKEHLWLEPILVTLRIDGEGAYLPPGPGKGAAGTLRFEIEPPLKPRPNAKPLPLEGPPDGPNAQCRDYDLFEWFAFPENGGTWTIRAIFEQAGTSRSSAAITVTVRKPGQGDAEAGPVARIHHAPWSNYDTNAFCGDTFDLVKSWPDSRLARYCHYWNGRYSQNKKEYDKAIASYRTVVEKYPDFALADDADYGIVECLHAQGKLAEAQKHTAAIREKYTAQAAKAGVKPGTGQTVVLRLANGGK